MNKFYGLLGFEESVETSPDVWEPKLTWRPYYGDILGFKKRVGSTDKVNDDINISNTISILSDSYAYSHLSNVKCIKWLGSIWKITDVDVQYPRLTLSIGGLYNVEDPEAGIGAETQTDSGE